MTLHSAFLGRTFLRCTTNVLWPGGRPRPRIQQHNAEYFTSQYVFYARTAPVPALARWCEWIDVRNSHADLDAS